MRKDSEWFAERIRTAWAVRSGRSFLLLVPAGCDMDAAAASVLNWCLQHADLMPGSDNLRPAIISLTVDNVSSTRHFVHRLGKELAKLDPNVLDGLDDDFPADRLMELVENAHAHGLYPLIIINRFHAFARIADEHLLSVLSTMRTLENDGLLTTLALSPLRYQALRRILSRAGHYPFVNSAYGDNHDLASLRPLSRDEFVEAATEAGIPSSEAYKLHRLAGGPDEVFRALLECGREGTQGIIDRAADRLGDRLEKFFDHAIDPELPDRDEIRVRLATGQLQPCHEDFLENAESAAFLVRRAPSGGLVAASPVLSNLLLRGREGQWRRYGAVLEHLQAWDFAAADELASSLGARSPRLEVFVGLVKMLRAIYAENAVGLLGMDWDTIGRTGKHLLKTSANLGAHEDWVRQAVRWSGEVASARDAALGSDVRLDVLIRGVASRDIQLLFLFIATTFLEKAARSPSPARRVRDAAVIPESILQALAFSHGINVRSAPETLPEADYQAFFGRKEVFQPPMPREPIAMGHLLVIVPALLVRNWTDSETPPRIADPKVIVPLHERLVTRMRNAAAHTYSDVSHKDADFLYALCADWLSDAAFVWNRAAADKIEAAATPTPEELALILFGGAPASLPEPAEAAS